MKICPVCKTEYHGGEVFCPNDGARLGTPSQMASAGPEGDALVGQIVDERYRILRRIGEGGMGIVYEAEHVVIEKRVALKVLRDDFSSRPEVVQRFRQEAKSASRIGSEHIVDISDFGETPDGASYFVMELLEGEDLASVLARDGSLPLERAADILEQCCRALYAAHQKGIVHRDMKPENIFLTNREGRADFVKIVDFGIAKMSDVETSGPPGRKLTKTGMIFGTPEYMSPEQAAGKELDHRVDIYALGVIFFEMLTGRVPFVGDTFMGILTQHMFEEPPRLRAVNPNLVISPAVQSFVDKALAKDPDKRFSTCLDMLEGLQKALAGENVAGATFVGYGEPVKYKPKAARAFAPEAATQELGRPAGPRRSRAGLLIGLGAAGALAAAGAIVWLATSPGAVANGGSVAGDGERLAARLDAARPEHDSEQDSGVAAVASARGGGADASEATLDAGSSAARRTVTVRVVTRPEGARVSVVGRGDVCMQTPCSFEASAHETITIRARRGRAEGAVDVTPGADLEVTIPLATRGGSSKQGHGTSEPGGHGDLKIPDVFRRPR